MGMDIQTQAQEASEGDRAAPNKTLRRACDCCRKRKVRCDGEDPCTPCKKAAIRCAYLQPPKKKGPKGLRSARVLHALRRIDDTANGSPSSPERMEHNGPFGAWQWGAQSQSQSPTTLPYQDQTIPPPSSLPYNPPTSMPLQPAYFHNVELPPLQNPPPPHSRQHHYAPPYRQDSTQSWSHSEPLSAHSETLPSMNSPSQTNSYTQPRIPSETFLPYIQLFFTHMFAIMPVIDRTHFLDPTLYATPSSNMPPEIYSFLSAISATTAVQLNTPLPPPRPSSNLAADDIFAAEALRARLEWDYIATPSALTIMTSFFLFCYHGNHEQHAKAWYYLQESLTFAELAHLDDEPAYAKLDPVEAQWRRRLYWLLFITERAYAVQRRKLTRLAPTITLPTVFSSESPSLLTGFVNLANLFSAVDDSFVAAWRGSRRQSLCTEAWLEETQRSLDGVALVLDCVEETQRLDIEITRLWLHVLAWQMGVGNGLIWGQGDGKGGGGGAGGMRLEYPIEVAGRVVEIITAANSAALDSHGIGMEQKLSDIAGCLADVLKCTAGDTDPTFAEGKYYLSTLLQQLSTIRGKESRYLRPLMEKIEGLIELPPPFGGVREVGVGVKGDGLAMLRSLSMSGNLGMPVLQADMWE